MKRFLSLSSLTAAIFLRPCFNHEMIGVALFTALFSFVLASDTSQFIFRSSSLKSASAQWAVKQELSSGVVRFDGDHLVRVSFSHPDDSAVVTDLETVNALFSFVSNFMIAG